MKIFMDVVLVQAGKKIISDMKKVKISDNIYKIHFNRKKFS